MFVTIATVYSPGNRQGHEVMAKLTVTQLPGLRDNRGVFHTIRRASN